MRHASHGQDGMNGSTTCSTTATPTSKATSKTTNGGFGSCRQQGTVTIIHFHQWRFSRYAYLVLVLVLLLLDGCPNSLSVDGFLHLAKTRHTPGSAIATTSRIFHVSHRSPCLQPSVLLAAAPPSEGDNNNEHRHTKKNLRLQVFQTLNNPKVEVVGFALVLLSSLLVALDTLKDLPPLFYTTVDDGLLFINLIFALDFFVRWYAAGQFKPIYLTKPLVVLDIVVILVPLVLGSAMLPLIEYYWGIFSEGNSNSNNNHSTVVSFLYGLQNSAGLRNLLLLRFLRLRRVLTDITTFGKFAVVLGLKPQDVRPYQLQLARVLLSILTLLSVASGLIYTAEHQVNAAIPDYFAAL